MENKKARIYARHEWSEDRRIVTVELVSDDPIGAKEASDSLRAVATHILIEEKGDES